MQAESDNTAVEAPREWLVTDGRGAFAMGTFSGVRTRKYHGFYQRVASRGQRGILTELELKWNGEDLWPHRYRADGGAIEAPPVTTLGSQQEDFPGVSWTWQRHESRLTFRVEPGLRLSWQVEGQGIHHIAIRPFFAFRDLHGVGGQAWSLECATDSEVRIFPADGSAGCVVRCAGPWRWERLPPDVYRNFFLQEERRRGYDALETFHTAARATLTGEAPLEGAWEIIASEALPHAFEAPLLASERARRAGVTPAALDFVLEHPPGVLAGYPWFGEWGRDTFVALPGLAHAWRQVDPPAAMAWAEAVLERWGRWIVSDGMLPNLLGPGETPYWESADATLWFAHAVACFQAWALQDPAWEGVVERSLPHVRAAIQALESGRHRYLRVRESDGLLEVSGDRTTWMDAFHDGRAVTPRNGVLPEIQALWFQARVLGGLGANECSPREWARRAARVLEVDELPMRPNRLFLFSLPFAPVLWDRAASDVARVELERLVENGLWTEVGPRTLSRHDPAYHGQYSGTQVERDEAYHQGPVWPWISAHAALAALRAGARWREQAEEVRRAIQARARMAGHWPEMLEGDSPHRAVGAPAQAWSLACWREYEARRDDRGFDERMRRFLKQRGMR